MSEHLNYGGQAVMEGVMMRGTRGLAVAVRAPDGGIRLRTEPLNPTLYAGRLARIPLLRGLPLLWDTLGLGMKALMWSAEVAAGEAGEAFRGGLGWVVGLLGVGLGLLLFMALPSFLVGLLPFALPSAVDNLLEAVVRLALILGYLWLVGRMPDIQRVFAYHGAEHKTINAYEDGAPLTVEHVQEYSTAHTRCGTAFLLTVVIVAMLVLAPLGRPALIWRVTSRLVLLPLIIGLSYEFMRFSARYGERPWLRWLVRPGLALQRLTTREPDDGMVEVAIQALQAVLAEEEQGDKKNGGGTR